MKKRHYILAMISLLILLVVFVIENNQKSSEQDDFKKTEVLTKASSKISFGDKKEVKKELIKKDYYDFSNNQTRAQFFGLDTLINLTIEGNEPEKIKELVKKIKDYEDKYAASKSSSKIFELNKNKILENTPDDILYMISVAKKVSKETNNALDISVFPIVKLWGFKSGKAKQPTELELNELLESVDSSKIKIDGKTISMPPKMAIDLASVAKGYIGNAIREELEKEKITAIIDLGENISFTKDFKTKKYRDILIKDPNSSKIIAEVELESGNAITSATYERFLDIKGTKYGHILDPKTGYPANTDIQSVTIFGDDGTFCDAISTATYVMGLEKAIEYLSERKFLSFLIITENTFHISEDLKDRFRKKEDFLHYNIKIY